MAATVGELLGDAARRIADGGSETALLDAELLLGHALHVDRTTVIAHPEAPVGSGQQEAFEANVVRRIGGEPVAYIRGSKEFYGLAFMVDRRALIPRPETELLVELAHERLHGALTRAPRPAGTPPITVWDVGTGSGAIAVTLAVLARRRGFARDVRFVATDASADALALATENAVGHGVADAITFAKADLLEWAERPQTGLIVANLPYVPSAVVPQLPVAASYEPRAALDGGKDGLAVIRRLLHGLPDILAPAGTALLEIGADQADTFREAIAHAVPGWSLAIHRDLGGRPRVGEVRRPTDLTSAGASDII